MKYSISLASTFIISLGVAITLVACQSSSQAKIDGTLEIYNDTTSCSIPLRDMTFARESWVSGFPGCNFGHIKGMRFKNAPSATTVYFRSFAYDYGLPERPPNPATGDFGHPAIPPAPNVNDCNADQVRYPFRLEIKTTGSIIEGSEFDIDDMLRTDVNNAVTANVRLIKKSADYTPDKPINYLISCIKILTN